MTWSHEVAYFFGGLTFTNAVPHWVSGLMGRAFQSPFANPRGVGLSTSRLNVWWGAFNFFLAYLLLLRVGEFDPRNLAHAVPFATAVVLGSVFLAGRFGRFHGGNEAKPEGA